MLELLSIDFQQAWAVPEEGAMEVCRDGALHVSFRDPVAALPVVAVPPSRHLTEVQRPLHVLNAASETHTPVTYTRSVVAIN